MDQIARIRALSSVEAFEDLEQNDLQALAEISEILIFKRDEILIQEGQTESAFYVLIEGLLKVVLPGAVDVNSEHRATDVHLNQLVAGDYFGEYSLIDGEPASASIIAIEPGSLLRISKNDFEAMIQGDDRVGRTIYHNLLKLLVRRLRAREDEYDQILVIG